MAAKKKSEQLTSAQLQNLPISIGEAKKLIGADAQNMSDNDVARKIILISELGRLVLQTFDLQ